MREYFFFSYASNEALYTSERKRQTIIVCMREIREELQHPIDKHSKHIKATNIELLLNHCIRFYDRQFVTREKSTTIYWIVSRNSWTLFWFSKSAQIRITYQSGLPKAPIPKLFWQSSQTGIRCINTRIYPTAHHRTGQIFACQSSFARLYQTHEANCPPSV